VFGVELVPHFIFPRNPVPGRLYVVKLA